MRSPLRIAVNVLFFGITIFLAVWLQSAPWLSADPWLRTLEVKGITICGFAFLYGLWFGAAPLS